MDITFGQFLRELRNGADVTQQELADFCNYSKQYISDIELGNNRAPVDEDFLEKISACLKLSDEQRENLKDYAAKARKDVAADIKEILINNPGEIKRLRRTYAKQ